MMDGSESVDPGVAGQLSGPCLFPSFSFFDSADRSAKADFDSVAHRNRGSKPTCSTESGTTTLSD